MTAQYAYAIAAGWDAASLDNIEDVIQCAPTAQPLKWGSVKRRTLDRKSQYNGVVTVQWHWAAISRSDFNILLTYLGSDLTIGAAEVSITTRDPLDNFITYNAIMENPLSGDDWQRGVGGYGAAEPLTLTFTIIEQTSSALLAESGFGLLTEDGGLLLTE